MSHDTNDTNYITMIDRAFEILYYISNHQNPVGISQIAKDLDLPKANIFRILNTLNKWDILERSANDKYVLGKGLIKYGNIAKERINLISISSPINKSLSQDIGETVNIGIMYEGNILTVYSEEGESSALVSKLIPISPLNCSSMGKIFLAHSTDEELIKYFKSNNLEKRTINTIINVEDFLNTKNSIIEENISFDNEEYEYGLSCVASGIKNTDGKVIAAISVSGPTSRLMFKGMEKIKEKLIDCAKQISESVAYI
ncbi:IclR family transcriptional regulator [Anaerosolibacter sp.]|uniref:IclR family transcriptional regulator n=1 Tax=Anaerosolibacter sp. TaxID=1872527 RepID=UPI0039F0676B